MHYLSIFSTLFAFFFAVVVFDRYRVRKGKHNLFWGLGLLLYGVGTATEVILGFTFSALALKFWYLSGAMLTAAWLGQGTVYLLVRRRGVATALAIGLALISLLSAALILSAPTTASASFDVGRAVSAQYKDVLSRSGGITGLTILLNTYGTLALVGGAIYSAFLFWRKRVLVNRVLGNISIAAGALMPATAGTFIRAGLTDWLYLSELIGVVLMYAGFVMAGAPAPQGVTSALTETAAAD